jgi:hypothetical protein
VESHMLSSQGVSAKELNEFILQVLSLVKTHCGVDSISKILGVSGATLSPQGTPAASANARSSNCVARLMGKFW